MLLRVRVAGNVVASNITGDLHLSAHWVEHDRTRQIAQAPQRGQASQTTMRASSDHRRGFGALDRDLATVIGNTPANKTPSSPTAPRASVMASPETLGETSDHLHGAGILDDHSAKHLSAQPDKSQTAPTMFRDARAVLPRSRRQRQCPPPLGTRREVGFHTSRNVCAGVVVRSLAARRHQCVRCWPPQPLCKLGVFWVKCNCAHFAQVEVACRRAGRLFVCPHTQWRLS